MSAKPILVEGERLRAIATLSGRTRCNVLLYDKADAETPLLVEYLNLASSKDRDTALERLGDWYHDEAGPLLAQLAAFVAAERAKPKAPEVAEQGPFPAVEPWEQEVNGAALLDALRAHITAHIVLPPFAADALALWVLHTYAMDVVDYTPYILITSPVRECGKTTLLAVLLHLAFRGKMTGGITAAALYRVIEKFRPTMLLDELDTRLRGDSGEALRGVLNTGFQRGGAITICVGDEHEAKDFQTFCPKVLAGIGRVWDTVTSRSIPVRLARASKPELAGLKKIRGDRIDGISLPYGRQATRWATDVREQLAEADPEMPEALGARQCDVWRPLMAIADMAGGHWPGTAREAALALHGVAQEEGDHGLLLLEDLRHLFTDQGTDAVFSATILEELGKRDDRPWSEYQRDKPITARGLAKLLGRFGVKPRTVRVGSETGKGYSLGELSPVFRTYLPALDLSVTSVTKGEVAGNVTDTPDTVPEASQPNLLLGNDVTDVTYRKQEKGTSDLEQGDAWEPSEAA